MSKLTDRASYLKGLADGMKLNPEKDTNKLLLEILPLLSDMAEQLDVLTDTVQEMDDYVEAIDDDLADLEETLFGDDEDDDEDDLDEEDDEIITYECPSCGHEIEFRASDVDFDEDYLCPACGASVFPELEDDEDEDDDNESEDDGIENPDQD